MVWNPFKRNRPATPQKLVFKSTEAAFEYASQFMQRPLVPRRVQDINAPSALLFGLVESVLQKRTDDSPEMHKVKLATDRGVISLANVGTICSVTLNEGDLILVEIASYDPNFAPEHYLQYFIAICRLKPVLGIPSHVFEIDEASLPNTAKTPI
jgi:hypothetical protein